jgi:hypothetical protein
MNKYLNENYQPCQPSPYKKELIEITNWREWDKKICVFFENRPKKTPTLHKKLEKAILEEGENLIPIMLTPIKEDDEDLYYLDENFNYVEWPKYWPRPLYGIPDGNNKFYHCRKFNLPGMAIISEKTDRSKIRKINNTGSPWDKMAYIISNSRLKGKFQEAARRLLEKIDIWKSKGFKLGSIVNIFSKDSSKINDTIENNCYNFTDENEEVLKIAYRAKDYMSAYSVERFLKNLKFIYQKYPRWSGELFVIGLSVSSPEEIEGENWNDAHSNKIIRDLIFKYTDIGRDHRALRATKKRGFNLDQKKFIIDQKKSQDDLRCHRCGKPLTEEEAKKNMDHFPEPWSEGDKPTNVDNGEPCCELCNKSASNFMTQQQKEIVKEKQYFTLKK